MGGRNWGEVGAVPLSGQRNKLKVQGLGERLCVKGDLGVGS